MTTLRNISSILSQQVLFRGRVQDALTNAPTHNPPAVTLHYQSDERPYPLTARVTANGEFVFSGDPNRAPPQPVTGETLDLRIRVAAVGYEAQTFDFSLDETTLTRTPMIRDLAGTSYELDLLNAPLWENDAIALAPIPVHLYGRVVRADNPNTPISGAEVRVIDSSTTPDTILRGPVVTDTNGSFAIRDMPSVLQAEISINRTSFTTLQQTINLDYGQPVNQHQFALE